MKYPQPLQEAVLIARYKRFLADVKLRDGRVITIHCPNTGSMMNCQDPGSRIWMSESPNAGRKYRYTWELIENADGHLVGINTSRANALAREALEQGNIVELRDYRNIQAEVVYGAERSRIDFLLSGHPAADDCFVEVKNVSLASGNGTGLFPDAVSLRGQKHLRELMHIRAGGKRAVLLFCVQHSGALSVQPADLIDPAYGQLLRQAAEHGVEILAYRADLSPHAAVLDRQLPVLLP